MDPSAVGVGGAVHYCCVFNGQRKLHSYNAGDGELESLAEHCLGRAPSYHAWYFHTVGRRTYGFFMEDGNTYFAIAESSLGSPSILRFLGRVRDGFRKIQKSGVREEEPVPVIQRLVASIGDVAQPTSTTEMAEKKATQDRPIPTDAPLLGKGSSKHDRKKMKDGPTGIGENHAVDVSPETLAGASTPKSLRSSCRCRSQQVARRLWWRHVRIIAAVDIALCLTLFGIWLAICSGFRCLSDGHRR